MLYLVSVRSKFEYTSITWKSITIAVSNKLDIIQMKFAGFCRNIFL
jgi:hypothetical protein